MCIILNQSHCWVDDFDHIWLPLLQFLRYPCPFYFPYYYYSFSASVYSLKFSFFCIRYISVFLKFPYLISVFLDIPVLFEISLSMLQFFRYPCPFWNSPWKKLYWGTVSIGRGTLSLETTLFIQHLIPHHQRQRQK